MSPPEPDRPFTQPWHAELFATTHALAQSGAFTWPEWAAHFGAALAHAETQGAPSDGSTYYEIWLEAFETFLSDRDVAEPKTLQDLKSAWTEAYLTTPHGDPVVLGAKQG